jgi:hypothetical protein
MKAMGAVCLCVLLGVGASPALNIPTSQKLPAAP